MEIKLWGKVEISLWASGKGKSLMSTMSLGKLEVLERPKSKWPYWLLYLYTEAQSDVWVHSVDYHHFMLKLDLMRDKIPVVIERQWGYVHMNGRKHKTQYGILYKFLNAEDRLYFLISQETGK